MGPPSKFLRFLDLINEQLFYNSDYIVVLDQHEWEKRGLEKVDVQQGIAYLEEKELIRKQRALNVWEEDPIPVDHENRQFMLDHDDRGVMSMITSPEQLKKLKFQVALLISKEFNKFYREHTEAKDHKLELRGVYYDDKAGVGWANGKRFKFKDHQPEFLLFGQLYKQIGEPVKKQVVFEITGYPTEGPRSEYFINELVTKMRSRTSLDVHELVLNNGNVTLISQKLDKFPTKQP